MKNSLPEAWQRALEREKAGQVILPADPGPERRLGRLLGAFISLGVLFLVVPGTLLGVWNLLQISASRQAAAVPVLWVQSHGHAQLFGWVASFMIGISLYAVPKFRGGAIRSLAWGWAMFGLWAAATASRWAAALWRWHWQQLLPAAAAVQLAVALLLLWQTTASGKSRHRTELWNIAVFAGLVGFAGTMLWQLVVLCRLPASGSPIVPPGPNRWLLFAALWLFTFPVAWGFSLRFLPTFLGLAQPRRRPTLAGLAALSMAVALALAGLSTAANICTAAAVFLACYSLRVFEPAERKAKTLGVDPRFPFFARLAFLWLSVAAVLQVAGSTPGLLGAARHAFTVGFLATLIFSIGPRILPSFLNSRELWSPRLMLWSLVLLAMGCSLRVASEPLAYSGIAPVFWKLLPVSATLELSAVLLFGFNIGKTAATPMPAWFYREQVKDTLPLYWYVTSYPATRRLLIEAGVRTLARTRSIPRSLTLREAAEAEGVDSRLLIERLVRFFEGRLARSLQQRG